MTGNIEVNFFLFCYCLFVLFLIGLLGPFIKSELKSQVWFIFAWPLN